MCPKSGFWPYKSPLIPDVNFPTNSSTHVLPGNQHLTRGEGKNRSIICSGLPGVPGPGMKEKCVISWFGGLSGSCPILREPHISNWSLAPMCVFSWDLSSVICQVEPTELRAAPLQ